MTGTDWLILGGSLLVLSVLTFMWSLAACASGKREDEAANQLSDGECCTDFAEESAFHRSVR